MLKLYRLLSHHSIFQKVFERLLSKLGTWEINQVLQVFDAVEIILCMTDNLTSLTHIAIKTTQVKFMANHVKISQSKL